MGVDRTPREGSIQIDEMQPLEALRLEVSRLRGRVVVEHRCERHVALHEANATPLLQVDRRKEDHGRHLKKLDISARPSFWLFSGWNCAPAMLSRATIAVTGPPYSVSATTNAGSAAAK